MKILPPAKPATSMWWASLRWKRATGDVTMGAALYYSATDKKITTTASGNVPAGYAAAPAASADETVLVKLLG